MHLVPELGPVDVMLPGFHGDSNTDLDWNPYYYIIGRPNATLHDRQKAIRQEPELYACNASMAEQF